MNYKYGIYSLDGRLWARTMTRIRAARMVAMLFQSRGLACLVKPITVVIVLSMNLPYTEIQLVQAPQTSAPMSVEGVL